MSQAIRCGVSGINGFGRRFVSTAFKNFSGYKNFNKPNMSENARWQQGYFNPINRDKCLSKENIYTCGRNLMRRILSVILLG